MFGGRGGGPGISGVLEDDSDISSRNFNLIQFTSES